MPRVIQRGYLSGVLQRGAYIVRALPSDRRAPFGSDRGRAAASVGPIVPLEIETFRKSPGKESQDLDPKLTPSEDVQSEAASSTIPVSDVATSSQKLDAGDTEPGSPRRSIETRPVSPEPPPAPQATRASGESSDQVSGVAEPAMPKELNRVGGARVFEPAAPQNESPRGIESLREESREVKSTPTKSSEPKGVLSFRIRDGYLRAQEILREGTKDSMSFEASGDTRAIESNSSVKSHSGLSGPQVFEQFSANASPQINSAQQRTRDEPASLRSNSSSVVAGSGEVPPGKIAARRDSAVKPRAENLTEALMQSMSVPRSAEAGVSQQPARANSISPDLSPKLTINRLDIQIIDQTPQPAIIIPTGPATQPDGAENIERYQLGHIHLIF